MTAPLPTPVADLRPCATQPSPGAVERLPGPDGSLQLDLGRVARIVVEADADASLVEHAACRTELALTGGRVTVHARELGGGIFRVHTPACDVVVRGTLFAVTLADDAVEIEVADGLVTIERGGDEIARVGAGESLVVRGSRRELEPLSVAAAGRIRSRVGLESEFAPGPPEQRVAAAPEPGLAPAPAAPEAVQEPAAREVRPENPAAGTETSRPPVAGPATAPARDEEADPSATGEDTWRRARELRAQGDFTGARRAFREAGSGAGPSAEGAWLELARMDLGRGDPRAALDALAEHRTRFGEASSLALEAAGLSLRAAREAGDGESADRTAQEIVRRWPNAAQAGAARQWLHERGLEGPAGRERRPGPGEDERRSR